MQAAAGPGNEYSQYYSNIYVQAAPPVQMPAHLWRPGLSYPAPTYVTVHLVPPPNTPPLLTTTGEQLQTPGVPRQGTASGGPPTGASPTPFIPASPPLSSYLNLRAPRVNEFNQGPAFNPATPLGLQGLLPGY